MKRYTVQLGKHRGKLYTNSGDTKSLRVNNQALPDGSIVTIQRRFVSYNWALINEDASYMYPMDLLVPIPVHTKINKILGGLREITTNAA
ncbi:MAG: hypothetical protein JHC33_06150 [Ignisphaera sp.]|nr:hypothetical protein [Ignisphaera sp.]